MAVINRFTTTDRAAISFTGNTLGLIGTFNPSQVVTTDAADGIGTFTTNNTGLISPGCYPAGTTQTFSLNSSSAILSILSGSTVLVDTLPNGTNFITNSVVVNNVTAPGANPNVGITVPNIAPLAIATITFQVKVQC